MRIFTIAPNRVLPDETEVEPDTILENTTQVELDLAGPTYLQRLYLEAQPPPDLRGIEFQVYTNARVRFNLD